MIKMIKACKIHLTRTMMNSLVVDFFCRVIGKLTHREISVSHLKSHSGDRKKSKQKVPKEVQSRKLFNLKNYGLSIIEQQMKIRMFMAPLSWSMTDKSMIMREWTSST